MSGRLVFALPGFPPASADEDRSQPALPRLPALEWLLARGRRTGRIAQPWRAWLLERCGLDPALLTTLRAGPATRLASGRPLTGGDRRAWWLCAQPVHLLTGLDRLQLAPPQALALEAAEAEALHASLAGGLEAAGLTLELLDPTHWLLRSEAEFEVEHVEPAAALGEDLRTLRPRGPHARRLLALRSEVEMSLHEHPVNVARERRGLPSVNSLWLHGAGRIATLAPVALPRLASDDPWLRGLWCALGAPLGTSTASLEVDSGRSLVHASSVETLSGAAAQTLQDLDAQLFGPARRALASARAGSLELLLGEEAWRVDASDRWRFWRRARPLHGAGA